MSDRKAELERKKERLRQMREEKEKRKREKEKLDLETAAQSLSNAQSGASSARGSSPASIRGGVKIDESNLKDIDKVLADIGIAPVKSVLDSMSSAVSGSSDVPTSLGTAWDSPISLGSGGDHQFSSVPGATLSPRPVKKELSVVTVQSTNIAPKETVTYVKQTQTIESGTDMSGRHRGMASSGIGAGGVDYYTLTYDEEYEEDSLPGLGSGSPSSESPSGYLSKLPPGILPHGMPEVKDVKPAVTKDEEKEKRRKEEEEEERRRRQVAELSQEEKEAIMMSDEFHKFFDRTTRLMERAMCEDSQSLFVDYTGGFEDGETGINGEDEKSSTRLSLNRYFHDERWTKNRVVTSMDWSAVFPELLVASYDKNPDAAHDPDGVCLVWNTRFKKTTPEDIFHCQSAVMSATFARFHPNLIIGGTYSGQIVLWDNRDKRRTPVQRSPLSQSAHTHPVYCTRVVGTQNAHNLISVSTDGRLCSWSLDMLSAPQETLELQQAKQSKPVAVTSLAFPTGDVNNFVVGSEDGAVYTACRHGSRAGVLDTFEGHGAPITGVSAHYGQGTLDFSHLFLTASMDWTVKLWSLKENRWPLYSFESNDDYVYDVAWSPTNPALFATVDGTGRLDLWNLNNDTEVSTASVCVEGPPAAFNRVSWTQSGLHVTAGDDAGKIWVYDVGESLALPGADEWGKFAHTLQDMRVNKSGNAADIDEYDKDHKGGVRHDHSGSVGVPGSGVVVGTGPGSLSSLTSLSSSPLR